MPIRPDLKFVEFVSDNAISAQWACDSLFVNLGRLCVLLFSVFVSASRIFLSKRGWNLVLKFLIIVEVMNLIHRFTVYRLVGNSGYRLLLYRFGYNVG